MQPTKRDPIKSRIPRPWWGFQAEAGGPRGLQARSRGFVERNGVPERDRMKAYERGPPALPDEKEF